MADANFWAVVPVKDFKNAKSRLASVMDTGERQQLSRTMLQDVLNATTAVARLSGTVMVTHDPEAAEIAADYGVRVFFEEENRGPTEAVMLAVRLLAAEGQDGMISIPSDVPLVSPAEINQLLQTHGTAPAVSITPAWDGGGSNAIVCTPPDAIPLSYGEGSFSAHLETAKRHGIDVNVIELPGLGLDLDQPDDLLALIGKPSQTLTARYLETSGISARMNSNLPQWSHG